MYKGRYAEEKAEYKRSVRMFYIELVAFILATSLALAVLRDAYGS